MNYGGTWIRDWNNKRIFKISPSKAIFEFWWSWNSNCSIWWWYKCTKRDIFGFFIELTIHFISNFDRSIETKTWKRISFSYCLDSTSILNPKIGFRCRTGLLVREFFLCFEIIGIVQFRAKSPYDFETQLNLSHNQNVLFYGISLLFHDLRIIQLICKSVPIKILICLSMRQSFKFDVYHWNRHKNINYCENSFLDLNFSIFFSIFERKFFFEYFFRIFEQKFLN